MMMIGRLVGWLVDGWFVQSTMTTIKSIYFLFILKIMLRARCGGGGSCDNEAPLLESSLPEEEEEVFFFFLFLSMESNKCFFLAHSIHPSFTCTTITERKKNEEENQR